MLRRWFAFVIVVLAVAGIWQLTTPDRPVAVLVEAETLECATVLDELWLVDDRGRAIRPGYPSDSCGLPKPGGLAAVKELTPVGSTEYRITLSDDQIYELSNCRPTYRPPTAGTTMPTSLSAGGVFCRFSFTEFIGTSSTTETIDDLPPAPDCDAVATEVASTIYVDSFTNQEQLLTVELDGCRRVIADGYVPLEASDELLESFR